MAETVTGNDCYPHSVKSIKYICKYILKDSDMTVVELQFSNTIDEISRYQVGHYDDEVFNGAGSYSQFPVQMQLAIVLCRRDSNGGATISNTVSLFGNGGIIKVYCSKGAISAVN
ncbi:unnamed protein product [Ceratitis capitata]|uniref:(Mediterranean fruit fly) hypothetical protein n=1 Tax=Ceratitis capitata TaxID=7213 RepID=A0A811UP20_CERCA|nr:unnamed protein product [Ceratitis capitata]